MNGYRAGILARAEISECGLFRYLLQIMWGRPLLYAEILTVCMLNSSTANGDQPDATVNWLIGWATKHGYDAIQIVNMAAFRTKSPKELLAVQDPHGVENSTYLTRYCSGKTVLCGWGNDGIKLPKYEQMLSAMFGADLRCLTTTKSGAPGHPLRKSHDLFLRPWPMAAA